MSAQSLGVVDKCFLEMANRNIAELEEDMDFVKRRAAALKCYDKRFPKWPETPSQLEHIQAFIELLDDLKTRGGKSTDIAELKRDLRAQLVKDGHVESEVCHRRYLADRIQRTVDAAISSLRAEIVEFDDVRKKILRDLRNSGNTMPTVGNE
ncbi:hypothetical protein FPOAC2_01951 [Fusarium poae]|uniref:Uncharacterized protein n=1 Tax=Fusarium poae TaxID=36050 RepID=A0A1B8B542_FUSPO|nr:hypothetical protein FPOAC1_001865 [Fusarium poae]KAG8675870.1 hypothetical protein FPOAC1_001865 [Fusarium poae]OBS27842.1 hypothetical protein FPOA_01784 [Fusarium poae]